MVTKDYHKKYYLKHRAELLLRQTEYQNDPEIKERQRKKHAEYIKTKKGKISVHRTQAIWSLKALGVPKSETEKLIARFCK